ncbi:MAG: hypothetical protein ACHQ53_14970 [Polyangiales bacterium]
MVRVALHFITVALALGCGRAPLPVLGPRPPASNADTQASAWPEADALFRGDPKFLGGDAAVSVPLGDERVLWLFGDSFVATQAGQTRDAAAFVRNSVAVQLGADPTHASLRLFVGTTAEGAPTAFFEDPQGGWFWPGHGLLLDGALTLFLERMQPDASAAGLGFRAAGFAVVRIDNPEADPVAWHIVAVPTPDQGELGLVGVSVLLAGQHVYAYAVREPGDHAVMLLRWPRAAFSRGELMHPQRWTGAAQGFRDDGAAAVVIPDGAAELSVSPDPRGGYVEVQSHGFGAAPIELRFSRAPEGPWTNAVRWYRPAGTPPASELWYAGRAHPELRGADLIVTYATNSLDHDRLLNDMGLYFPRFVRSRLGRALSP